MKPRLAFAFVLAVLSGCRDPAVLRDWLAVWEKARACMLASPEYGPDSETAYAVASFLKENYCPDERVRLIAISDADRASVPHWNELRKELESLVGGEVSGSSIDTIDVHVARLREVAQLQPIVRERTHVVIPLGPAATYDEPNADSWPGPGMLTIAMPSRSWTAEADGNVLTINEHDAPAVKVNLPGDYSTSRAMDRVNARVVTLKRRDKLGGFGVAHSEDSGRTWTIEGTTDDLPLTRSSQDPHTGTIFSIVEALRHVYLYRFNGIGPWRLPTPIAIPRFNSSTECHSGDVLYSLEGDYGTRLLRVDESALVLDTGASSLRLEACDHRSALLWNESRQVLSRCRDGRCTIVHEAAHTRAERFESAATLSEDGKWMLASLRGNLVGVWREGNDEPTFYRLQRPGSLVKLRASKPTVQLILEIDGRMHAVTLPK